MAAPSLAFVDLALAATIFGWTSFVLR